MKDKSRIKIIILTLFLILLYNCSTMNIIEKEKVKDIKVTFLAYKELRDSPLEIVLQYEGTKELFLEVINNAKKAKEFMKVAKIEEGEYIIEIKYKNEESDRFIMDEFITFYWENREKTLKSIELLPFLRGLLFIELERQGIKLQ